MNQRREGGREARRDRKTPPGSPPRSLQLPPRRGFLLADCEIACTCAAKVPVRYDDHRSVVAAAAVGRTRNERPIDHAEE